MTSSVRLKPLAALDSEDVRLDRDGDLLNKDRLKKKLRPLYWWLYDVTLGAIAAECRAADVPVVMVIIPRVGKADVPSLRAEPVARLTALAAHQGVTVFDLSDTFDQIDPAKLEIAAWDDHPNVIGHHRLFLALARALVKDQERLPIAFFCPEDEPANLAAAPPQAACRAKASEARPEGQSWPRGPANLPSFDKIVVWDQDDVIDTPVKDGIDRMDARHLSELLEQAAAKRPDHAAVEDEHGRRLSYSELLLGADRLATRLIRWGVERGDRVGLWLPKSLEAVTAIHGILRTGAAYVPVDPTGPAVRAAAILASSGVKAAVVAAELAPSLRAAWGRTRPLPRLILVEAHAGRPQVAPETNGGFESGLCCVSERRLVVARRGRRRTVAPVASARRRRPGLHPVHVGLDRRSPKA